MHIVRAYLDDPIGYPAGVERPAELKDFWPLTGRGDVWTTTWADDGNLYSVSDDTYGFGNICNSNLAIHRMTGDTPPDLHGETINCMRAYGADAERGADRASWKANGLACIDGVLYLAVSRHHYMNDNFPIQQTWDATIVKSEDYGRTWNCEPPTGQPFAQPMFPGHTFSTPFFVHYGQGGQGTAHGADTYIYAVSSDGVWNNGSSMTLGRVRRDRIAHLDPADWEYVNGYDEARQPIWGARQDTALYTFRAPGRTSMTGIHYIAPLGLYIMPQWHYPCLEPYTLPRSWQVSRWDFYQAPAPWGPWTLFHSQEFDPQGFYNPCIPAKFVSADGRSMWIFTAGDFQTQAYYYLHMMRMTLKVEG